MQTHTIDGVVLLRSPLLEREGWLGHAISTRVGGVSRPPYDALNLAGRLGDEPRDVLRNRELLCAAAGARFERLTSARQVLGAAVADVTEEPGLTGSLEAPPGNASREVVLDGPVADALVTRLPETPLLTLSADCVLILLADPRRRAVASVHASRLGTFGEIARRTVERMAERHGTDPRDVVAAVAPSIGPCCYEVGAEVVAAARHVDGAEACLERRGDATHLDLWTLNEHQLRAAGVRAVDVARRCTRCEGSLFYSYRRDGARSGRFGAVVWVRG